MVGFWIRRHWEKPGWNAVRFQIGDRLAHFERMAPGLDFVFPLVGVTAETQVLGGLLAQSAAKAGSDSSLGPVASFHPDRRAAVAFATTPVPHVLSAGGEDAAKTFGLATPVLG